MSPGHILGMVQRNHRTVLDSKVAGRYTTKRMPKPAVILTTKIHPPQLKEKFVPRAGLMRLIRENLDRKLIVLCADAGYGKTTVLSQFCHELTEPYVYYALDAGDNHIGAFIAYLIKGIQQHAPAFGADILGQVADTRDWETIVGMFINELVATFDHDFFIVLDDYHHVQTNQELAKLLEFLLRHLPKHVHLVIASRSHLPLNLPYYTSKQELLLIEKEHLRFSEEEIRVLFNDVYKLKIPADDIRRIAEHSAGWITAIQLLLQKIAASEPTRAGETIHDFVDSGRELYDYFTYEIVETQPPPVRDFLVRSSILETITPVLADRVLGIKNSRKILDYLAQENVFVSRAGDDYKYHPLFREALLRQLRSFLPDQQIVALHNKLGVHYQDAGDYSQAVHHFAETGNYRAAAHLLVKQSAFWLRSGAFEAYMHLLDRLPANELMKFPALMVKKMICLQGLGYNRQVLTNAPALLKIVRRARLRDVEAELRLTLSGIHFLRREYRQARRDIQEAQKCIRRTDWLKQVQALTRLSTIYSTLLSFDQAKACLEKARTIANRSRNAALQVYTVSGLAQYNWQIAEFDEAYALFSSLINDHKEHLSLTQFMRLHINLAILAFNTDRQDGVWPHFAEAERYALRLKNRPGLMDIEYWKAQIHIAQGAYPDALSSLASSLEICRALNLAYPEFLNRLAVGEIHLRLGNAAKARDMLDQAGKVRPATISRDTLADQLFFQFELELHERNFEAAGKTLHQLDALLQPLHQDFYRMIRALRHACLEIATGALAAAARRLPVAFSIARHCGYDALLISLCPYLGPCLELAIAEKIELPYLARIIPRMHSREARELLKKIQIQEGMFDIECRFLGPFTIMDRRGVLQNISWRTKKAKSLFAWLVYSGEKGCTSDQLIDEFWPDKKMDVGIHCLQVEISSLRSLVASWSLHKIPPRKTIVYANGSYRLAPGLTLKTDIEKYADLMARAQAEPDPKQRIPDYEQALAIAPDVFCSDLSGTWCDAPRAYYREEVMKALKAVGRHYFQQRRYAESLRSWRDAQKIDPYDEEVLIALLKTWQELGDKKAARQCFRSFLEAAKELDIGQPPEEAVKINEWAER